MSHWIIHWSDSFKIANLFPNKKVTGCIWNRILFWVGRLLFWVSNYFASIEYVLYSSWIRKLENVAFGGHISRMHQSILNPVLASLPVSWDAFIWLIFESSMYPILPLISHNPVNPIPWWLSKKFRWRLSDAFGGQFVYVFDQLFVLSLLFLAIHQYYSSSIFT